MAGEIILDILSGHMVGDERIIRKSGVGNDMAISGTFVLATGKYKAQSAHGGAIVREGVVDWSLSISFLVTRRCSCRKGLWYLYRWIHLWRK